MSTTTTPTQSRPQTPTSIPTAEERQKAASFPLLTYPARVPSPVFIPIAVKNARTRESSQQSAVHAAMVAQAAIIFNIPPGEAIQAFAQKSPDGTKMTTPSKTPTETFVTGEGTTSSAPLPVPPRLEYTPSPCDIPVPKSPRYAPRSPSPDPIATGEIVCLSESPNSPKPYVHPGGDWVVNCTDDGRVAHDVTIQVVGGGGEETVTAPFIQYDFDTDNPELLTTLGRNCKVDSRFLHARPQPYNSAPFTRQQRSFFLGREHHTPLVDQALDRERDVSLRAEVQRYRRFINRQHQLARQLAELKHEFDKVRGTIEDSIDHLAQADHLEKCQKFT
jgi:hypothetical protein